MQRWNYTVTAKASFGGFTATLTQSGALLLIRANRWKGAQPRLALERLPKPGAPGEWTGADPGFDDWLPLLQPCNEGHEFQGNDTHAQNLVDQWLGLGQQR